MIPPIKGAQALPPLPSNNAQLECIRVKKVYDWVVVSSITEQLTVVPADCLERIRNIKNLVIKCCPPTDILPPSDHDTQVISIKRGLPGLSDTMAVVTFRCFSFLKLMFFDGDNPSCPGTSICCVQGTFPIIVRDVVLCLPEPLNADNIVCGVLSCSGSGILIDDEVEIDLSLCVDVQVEVDVKLEVLAKFCQPRPPLDVPPAVACPPVVNFPQQCPSFFPIANCDCQGEVVNTQSGVVFFVQDGLTLPVPGTESVNGFICPNCSPQGSTLAYSFDPSSMGYTFDSSFAVTFFANFSGPVNAPVCTTIGLVTTLVVNGTGLLTLDSQTPVADVPFYFTLTADASTNTCVYNLQINTAVNGGMVPFVPTLPLIYTGNVAVPCTSLLIRDCVRIPPGV